MTRVSGRFEKHARTVSLLTLVSRLTGLARDATLSRVFGAGPTMDAFFFAFMIPNLFRRLFGEGALSAAFLPVYAKLRDDDPATAQRLSTLLISALAVGLGALVIVGETVLLLLSNAQDHGHLALWLMMIMLPYMPLVCLVALLGAMLQVRGRFGPPAAAPVLLNLCLIGGALGGGLLLSDRTNQDRLTHIGITAGAVVLAGLLQVAWSLIALRGEGWWRRDAWRNTDARQALRRVVRQAGPMIVGLGVLQFNTFIDGLIASYPVTVGPTILGRVYPLSEGAMATVSFAQRLYQFPLAVFGIAIATAIFPLLARQSGDEQRDDFRGTIQRGLRLVVFIGLPASVGLILVRQPLATVILQGGAFDIENARRVGFVLLGYAPAIWAYSMTHVLTRAFYAREDAATPVKVALGVVVLNIALNCTLIWTPLKEAGLAWSTAVCAIVQVGVLLLLLRRHTGAVLDRAVCSSWARTVLASALMGGVVFVIGLQFEEVGTWSASLGQLLVLVASGGVVVALLALALKMPELGWAIGRSKRS